MDPVTGNDKLRDTILDLSVHVIVTAGIAAVLFFISKSWVWVFLVVTGGILIDVDHFMDYFLHFGPRFNILRFLRHEYQASGKCYVIFHSWEILALLFILSVFIEWVFPLAAGMAGHMAVDGCISHRRNLLSLSLLYRWNKGFGIADAEPSGNGRENDNEGGKPDENI
jgi:hypothetical protein